MKTVIAGLFIISLGGCTTWPGPGSSGPGQQGDELPWREVWDEQSRITPSTLEAELERSRMRLEILSLKKAKECLPGHLLQNRRLAVRIGREIYGGLYGDAETNLIVLRTKISKMEKRLAFLEDKTACVNTPEPPPVKEQRQQKVSEETQLSQIKHWRQGFRKQTPLQDKEKVP